MNFTWLLVQPNQEGKLVEIDNDIGAQRAYRDRLWREAGAHTPEAHLDGQYGSDFEALSRHFHVAVYEWGVTEGMPLNWNVVRAGRMFPLSGPVLVYKTDDTGESVNLTPMDAITLNSYIRQQRAGLYIDSRLLG
jgi:hypothetical protein